MEQTLKSPSILDTPVSRWFPFNLENALALIIILLALVSRFYDLGARVMSHDEINHVVPAYDFYQGRGYHYDPVTHGPLQFHLLAGSFWLFGDSDFSVRIPAAIFSVATIVFTLFAYRRYFGRVGALAAGLFFLISPYMLFYGRYARNEVFIVFWGVVSIYTILRYLELGEERMLVLFTVISAFHFVDKATAYIFAAEQLLFLGVYFIYRLLSRYWRELKKIWLFLVLGLLALTTGGLAAASAMSKKEVPLLPPFATVICLAVAILLGVAAMYFLIRGVSWQVVRNERSFNLVALIGTLILPLMAALPVRAAGWNPLDYTQPGIITSAIAIGLLSIAACGLGILWRGKGWLKYAIIFYAIFFVFYSTIFTNPTGLASGLMGALGYWMEQQAVERGSQPVFYYAFLQIPMYEYLPALGTILAAILGFISHLWHAASGKPFERPGAEAVVEEEVNAAEPVDVQRPQPVPTLALLVFWSFSSLIVFSFAGEKMPWLTTHIAMPMILTTGWFVGYIARNAGWQRWAWGIVLTILAIFTARTAYRAAYINYDYPYEYLVYAHAAGDPKYALNELENLSHRLTGGLDISVAYDNQSRYPYWWYLRRYPNRVDYDENPTRDLRNMPVIFVGEPNYPKIASVVRNDFVEINYMRLWWPNQDYWRLKWVDIDNERRAELNLAGSEVQPPEMTIGEYLQYTWRHLSPFIFDPEWRKAAWKIWFDTDYSLYSLLQNSQSMTLTTWNPAERMRMYVRKDVAAMVWDLNTQPVIETEPADPYEKAIVQVAPDKVIGMAGTNPGEFQAPRAIAIAPDGSLYVADSRNHRIQHLDTDGLSLQTWGSFADSANGPADGGTFNEPWGVAVGPDGSVYVADTWNHRIQKFAADGRFLLTWGSFGQGETPDAFWGPRGIAVDDQGHVYVADTGNKRIVVFDENGAFITQFGTEGMELGQLNEPVAVALDAGGRVYVTDTWNQRVQVFDRQEDDKNFYAEDEWGVEGWFGQSLENKPFIAVTLDRNVLVTDPEMGRVLEFTSKGAILHAWDLNPSSPDGFSLLSGLALDSAGGVWVSDAQNQRLVHFSLSVE